MTLLARIQQELDEQDISAEAIAANIASELEQGLLELSGNFRGCEASTDWRE